LSQIHQHNASTLAVPSRFYDVFARKALKVACFSSLDRTPAGRSLFCFPLTTHAACHRSSSETRH